MLNLISKSQSARVEFSDSLLLLKYCRNQTNSFKQQYTILQEFKDSPNLAKEYLFALFSLSYQSVAPRSLVNFIN